MPREWEFLTASHEKNLACSFFKRLEIHPAFQTSCPWDLCETSMVSWNALSLLPPWGWHVLCGRSSWKCYTGLSFTWKCCKFILMRIFTEMPHKFCIYDLLGVIFISSVRSWLTCVVNKRYFFLYNADLPINRRGCDLWRLLKIFKRNLGINEVLPFGGFSYSNQGSQRYKRQLELGCCWAQQHNWTLKGFTSTWGSSLPSLGNPLTLPKLCWVPLGFGGQQGEVYRPKRAILRLWLTFQAALQD